MRHHFFGRLHVDASRGRGNRQSDEFALERDPQHFVHDRQNAASCSGCVRNIRKIFLIVPRNDHFIDAMPVSRHKLLLQAADRKHLAAQSDFAGHGDIAANRNFG